MDELTKTSCFLDVSKALLEYEYGEHKILLKEFIDHCIHVKYCSMCEDISIGDAFRLFIAQRSHQSHFPRFVTSKNKQTQEILMFEIALLSKRYMLKTYDNDIPLDAHVSDYVDYHIQSKQMSLDGLGTFGRSSISMSSKLVRKPVRLQSTAVLESDALKLTQSHTIVTSHLIPVPQQPAVLDLISPMPATSTAINPDYNSILSILQASAAHYPSHCNLEKPLSLLNFDWAGHNIIAENIDSIYKPTEWFLPSVVDAVHDTLPIVTTRRNLFRATTRPSYRSVLGIRKRGDRSTTDCSGRSTSTAASCFGGIEKDSSYDSSGEGDGSEEYGLDKCFQELETVALANLAVPKRRRSAVGISIVRNTAPSSDSGASSSSLFDGKCINLGFGHDNMSMEDFDTVWD
jgi:hypothetical protein